MDKVIAKISRLTFSGPPCVGNRIDFKSIEVSVTHHVNLKDEKSIKKQTYTKTETCKLYSRV